MTPTLATRPPWHLFTFDALRAAVREALHRAQRWIGAPRVASLCELDARTLRDIGVDASEIASIDAEARGHADVTRLRIASGWHHV